MTGKHAPPAEHGRLQEEQRGIGAWRRWGPYLSERQWGTVREDYSADGSAWSYFPHDMAPWRAYRWGEDGIAGISDNRQRLCLALALWNGRDPILKERLFGLTNEEGNHGEDVKELYWYLDATPTHSYLKFLYKYPQAAFPYALLREESRRRARDQPSFGLLDTGLFDEDRYFDILVEYAKAAPDDLLMLVTVTNRGPDRATLHLLPQLWFRNTWSWDSPPNERPGLCTAANGIEARHPKLGTFRLDADDTPQFLFCDNDSNPTRFGKAAQPGYFKDAFHEYVVHERRDAVNPRETGTKAVALYRRELAPGGETRLRLRLARHPSAGPFTDFDAIVASRRREADEFYDDIQRGLADDPDARRVHRQALAGMIWNKQYYRYDVPRWLAGDPTQPPPSKTRCGGRNAGWEHLNAAEILSMPDKWEYPWFAAWDTAFHCLPFVLVDPAFAKEQLVTLTREWYLHPSGQIPAYEWDFNDANPPVQAWAAWQVFRLDRERTGGAGDLAFLERVFHKLMLNFTWWVNRKDAQGRNVFQGGFLGLDNIGVFERSKPAPGGGSIDQADGTAWMAMFALDLMRIALELAQHNAVYEDIASKFFEHFLQIAQAMTAIGPNGACLWDDTDGFFYDALRLPDGRARPMKVRSAVGLVPLFAVEVLEPELLVRCPGFEGRLRWLLDHRPALAQLVSRWQEPGSGERRLLSLLRGHRMKLLLRRLLDETEFLSPFGVRSLSKRHADEPYDFSFDGHRGVIAYTPGESTSDHFGGNSNWRGPIWLPLNFLIIASLRRFHRYYGDDFKIECPTGSGRFTTIAGVADEIARRVTALFTRQAGGERAVFGNRAKLQHDPHFRDHLLFYEYFHGDTGAGLGAAHQTGWTGLVANLLQPNPPAASCER
jgi:Mannosylglycerate hydrolase MGH1-like glycoside hydrolase domain